MTVPTISDTRPTQDERILAALAHTCNIFSGLGTVVNIAIWATQKDKSRFVAFQVFQALA